MAVICMHWAAAGSLVCGHQLPRPPISLARMQMKMPQLTPQAEAFLQQLAQGVDGRLHPYHARVIGELPLLVPAPQAVWFLAKICCKIGFVFVGQAANSAADEP